MELNRRKFISMIIGGAVGGAVGINATPLPWKLTDDIAIWTQNWPWVPVPPVGEFTHETSVCTLCPGGCGIQVRKVGERAVKIEGRTDYPVNPGGVCPMGAAGLQLLYNETIRYTGPMKRVGPRGVGKFQEISWDEALQVLSNRIMDLKKRGRPEALAAVDGNPSGSTISHMVRRFMEAAGSPNYLRIPTMDDTYEMANMLMMGNDGPMAYDLENADFILSFGCGLIDGWGAPGRVIGAWGKWHSNPRKREKKVVQIESRASNTASKADRWLAPKPGTEAALALGLAHVIIKEGSFNGEFVNNYSSGFPQFKKLVIKKYSPESVARITGLKAGDIASLAREFSGAKASIAICGKGKGDLNGSLFEFMAVQTLNALKGNINKPGGVIVHDPLPLKPWPDVKLDAAAKEGLKKQRIDQAGSEIYPFSRSLINNFSEAIMDDSASPVDTILIFSSNPVYTLPDGGAFQNAMDRVPYIVSFSPYKDDTSLMADLILPDHTYLEKTDDIVWPSGLQYPLYGLSRPVVAALYDTEQSGDVIIKLAKKVGGSVAASFPWKNYEGALKARAKGLYEAGGGLTNYDESRPAWKAFSGDGPEKADYKSFDDMWKKIKSNGLWYRPSRHFKNWSALFHTPTGKFEFFSSKIEHAVTSLARESSLKDALQKMGINAEGEEVFMPHYEAVPSEMEKDKYPLLIMPYELINLSSGWLPNPHFLTKTLFDNQIRKMESFAEINPKTASEFKLKQGDRIIIQSPEGKIKVRVNLFEGAMPGVLFLPVGFGHRAYDEYQRDKGVSPNVIMVAGKDPLSGQAVWWDTHVKLIKI